MTKLTNEGATSNNSNLDLGAVGAFLEAGRDVSRPVDALVPDLKQIITELKRLFDTLQGDASLIKNILPPAVEELPSSLLVRIALE